MLALGSVLQPALALHGSWQRPGNAASERLIGLYPTPARQCLGVGQMPCMYEASAYIVKLLE